MTSEATDSDMISEDYASALEIIVTKIKLRKPGPSKPSILSWFVYIGILGKLSMRNRITRNGVCLSLNG